MSLSVFMKSIFFCYEDVAFIPAAILCYMPMCNQIRRPVKKIVRDCVVLFVICYAGLGLLKNWAPWLNGTIMLVPFLVIAFIYYIFSVKALLAQCAAVFVCACTLCAIPLGLVYLFEAIFRAESIRLVFVYEIMELALVALICILFMPAFHRTGRFLVDDLQQPWIWISTIPYSLLTYIVLVLAGLDRYHLMETPAGREIYLIIYLILSGLYLFSIVFFASVCRHVLKEERFRARDFIYRLQKKQYEEMRDFLGKMQVYRHDIRHTMRTVKEMAYAGDTDAILSCLEEKGREMPEMSLRRYCENSIVNAVLNYYLNEAEQSRIVSEIKVSLPELTSRQAVDLSSVLANLLENAVLACREIPAVERQMALTVRTVNEKNIYIVSANTFSGKVRMRRGEYQSTRTEQGGSGIGLRSMRAVTERYHGTMKAYHEGRKFFVDIMMNAEPVRFSEGGGSGR